MSKELLNYLSNKVINDIRSRNPLKEELALELNKPIYLDCLRPLVDKYDIELLLSLAEPLHLASSRLAISLLRNFVADKRVKEFLINSWTIKDYLMRRTVIWRLLDYIDLENSMHDSIYEFVKINWKRWMEDEIDAYRDDTGDIKKIIESRLKDPTFPRTKDWVYLCLSLGSNDADWTSSLLSHYYKSEVSIVGKVANELKIILDEAISRKIKPPYLVC